MWIMLSKNIKRNHKRQDIELLRISGKEAYDKPINAKALMKQKALKRDTRNVLHCDHTLSTILLRELQVCMYSSL